MDNYELGEHGLVIPFGAMFENGDFTEYEGYTVAINVATVTRNVINAFKGTEAELLSTLPEQLDMTMTLLYNTFRSLYNMSVIYYRCSYSDTRYGTLGVKLKETPRRKMNQSLIDAGLKNLEEGKLPNQINLTIDGSVSGPDEVLPEKLCIVTHYAQDLLNHRQFDELVLIESHTGAVKTPKEFNTKLSLNPEQKKLIPFGKFAQRVFGDGTLYGPMDIDIRRTIVEIAEKSGWVRTTPINRIGFLLKKHNPALANAMSRILN